MCFNSHTIQAGHTVTYPRFAPLQEPAHAVVVEIILVKNAQQAELDNGHLLPLEELRRVETGEQWAAVAGYEHYRVSSHGKVVSLHYNRQPRQRLLKPLNTKRYPEIGLSNQAAFLRIGLNRLVAQTFLPPPADDSLEVVIPKDGNRLNICVDNLQWASLSEMADKPIWRYLRGSRTCKLQAADIAQIRQLAAQGLTQQVIADKFGVSRPSISLLLSSTTQRLNE